MIYAMPSIIWYGFGIIKKRQLVVISYRMNRCASGINLLGSTKSTFSKVSNGFISFAHAQKTSILFSLPHFPDERRVHLFGRRAHLFVFCLVWLLCCPTLCALVHLVPCGTNLGCPRQVCVALCAHRAGRLASLGRRTVHLQAPQLAALEAALVHDAT